MKKFLIISVIALACSVVSANAYSSIFNETNYESRTEIKVSPFCTSIAKGDLDTVKKLIGLGADVNQKSNGMTPAMYAAKFNRLEILELLINKGANLKVRSDKGLTAKKYAQQSNAREVLVLIESTLSEK